MASMIQTNANDDENIKELRALVVGFLQQSLADSPHGLTVQQFERFFPEKTDEPRDWYRRYNSKNTVEALAMIKESVKVNYSTRYNATMISLNQDSEFADNHLIDLIQNQKSSGKRKSNRPSSSRALSSFSLNRQYSRNDRNRDSHRFRMNHGQHHHQNSFFRKPSPPLAIAPAPSRPSLYSRAPTSRMASADPRNRSATSAASPQIRAPPAVVPKLSTSSIAASEKKTHQSSTLSNNSTTYRQPTNSASTTISRSQKIPELPKEREDPVLDAKKDSLAQKIESLLKRKFAEIKLLHLNSLFSIDYSDNIDPLEYGHKTMTSLIQDPIISQRVQLNIKSPFVTISARLQPTLDGKENLMFVDSLKEPESIDNQADEPKERISSLKAKWDAVDTFNVRTMLQNLEPLGDTKEPPLRSYPVDEGVKYKTLRMIFKSADNQMKIDDWELKFEQESRLKIRIRDYGFKTFLEFFKHLSKELPINIELNLNDEWIAKVDLPRFSDWIQEQLTKGRYRAIIAVDYYYELIAIPSDEYTFCNPLDLVSQEYFPAIILSVRRSNHMWVQLRTPKRIEDHLCMEASLTCYEDYKERNLSKVPSKFVRPGFPCVVFDKTQQRWCRALVLKAPEVIDRNYDVTALLVDYGIVKTFPTKDIRSLMRNHLRLPVGPIYARLAGINNQGELSVQQRAKQILQEYTSPPVTLACKFISDSQTEDQYSFMPKRCMNIILVDTRQGKDCHIADDINLSRNIETE